jgi:hypothetical protein
MAAVNAQVTASFEYMEHWCTASLAMGKTKRSTNLRAITVRDTSSSICVLLLKDEPVRLQSAPIATFSTCQKRLLAWVTNQISHR